MPKATEPPELTDAEIAKIKEWADSWPRYSEGTVVDGIHRLLADHEQLQNFKNYVHGRLDKLGIEEHQEAECRVGRRLDDLTAEDERLQGELEKQKRCVDQGLQREADIGGDLCDKIQESERQAAAIARLQKIAVLLITGIMRVDFRYKNEKPVFYSFYRNASWGPYDTRLEAAEAALTETEPSEPKPAE